MNVGMMYSIFAFVCMAVVSLVLNRILATKYRELVDKPFCILLLFFLLFCFVDGLWGIAFSREDSWFWYTILTYGFHCMSAFSAFMWSGYMVKYMSIGKPQRMVLHVVRSVLLVMQIGVLISNIWTKKTFYISSSVTTFNGVQKNVAKYVTCEWRNVLFYLQFSYYVILTIVVVYLLFTKQGKKERSAVYSSAFIFSMIPLIAGIFQRLFPDAPMYSIGFMISAVTIYSFNTTRQREEFLTKQIEDENTKFTSIISGLSNDFKQIYYVDMDTEKYELFGNGAAEFSGNEKNERYDFFTESVEALNRIIYPEDKGLIEQCFNKEYITKELESKQSYSFNVRFLDNGQIRYYYFKIIRPEDSDGNKIIVGLFDDDERVHKDMEQQEKLREAQMQAENASRAKTNFLFNMSHDIRTPMNAILGFADMAQKNIGDSEKAAGYIEKVKSSSRHLLTIINDVLDMSRIENGKVVIEKKPISLRKLCEELIDLVAGLASEKKITLEHESSSPEHEFVIADEMRVNRVLMNVLTNSIKYTKEGGTVSYGLKELPSEKEGYRKFVFTISDTGIGMSEEYLDHIFEMFSRERNSTTSGIQGTGLGMAITKSLVELMDGSIDIKSELGVGTTVTISFDFELTDGASAQDDEIGEDELSALRGKKVLLTEDNELNREIALDILSEFGMTVDNAENGAVAVEKCRDIIKGDPKGYYDVILMDIQMPIMDGYTAASEIRNIDSDYAQTVPIIAMTANVFAEDIEKAIQSGMNAHLAKPIDVKEFAQVLKKNIKK